MATYSGPVPQGYDEDIYRKSGYTVTGNDVQFDPGEQEAFDELATRPEGEKISYDSSSDSYKDSDGNSNISSDIQHIMDRRNVSSPNSP